MKKQLPESRFGRPPDSREVQKPQTPPCRAAGQPGCLKAKPYLWPLALAFGIFLASGTQRLAAPDLALPLSKDKFAHFLVFGLLATAILRTPRFGGLRLRDLFAAALIASAYGAFDELRQSLTPGRSVEPADWFADTLGALGAVFVYARWHAYRRLLEWRRKKRTKP